LHVIIAIIDGDLTDKVADAIGLLGQTPGLQPARWSPDPDTIADAYDVDYQAVSVVHVQPVEPDDAPNLRAIAERLRERRIGLTAQQAAEAAAALDELAALRSGPVSAPADAAVAELRRALASTHDARKIIDRLASAGLTITAAG
jgi:hypothetical protein